MKTKIRYYLGTIINWFKLIKIYKDNKPISTRYTTEYFSYLDKGLIERKSKYKKIVYSGRTEFTPSYLRDLIINDINDTSSKIKDYVIIFDNWK